MAPDEVAQVVLGLTLPTELFTQVHYKPASNPIPGYPSCGRMCFSIIGGR